MKIKHITRGNTDSQMEASALLIAHIDLSMGHASMDGEHWESFDEPGDALLEAQAGTAYKYAVIGAYGPKGATAFFFEHDAEAVVCDICEREVEITEKGGNCPCGREFTPDGNTAGFFIHDQEEEPA